MYKELALFIGSFLMPKFVNKGLQVETGKKVVLRDSKTGRFTLTNKSSSMLNNILLDEKKMTQVVDIYSDEFIADLLIRSENLKYSVYEVTDDFFGVLKGFDLNEKKINVLDTYKLIFRFSICKLIDYLSRPELLIMTVQYLQDTQMDRVHRRKVLAKNQKAYYRALENLLNLCSLNYRVKEALNLPETSDVDLSDLEN